MWQRIQSIYLCLVVILMACTAFIVDANNEMMSIALSIVAGLAAAIAAFDIALFHNRRLQMSVCHMAEFLCIAWIIIYAADIFVINEEITELAYDEIIVSAILPMASTILLHMAWKGIKYDDDLVRSADRIR